MTEQPPSAATASEHEAEIASLREQVNYFKTEYQDDIGLSGMREERDNAVALAKFALLARLREPDVREAAARAMCKRRNTKQCAAICLSHSSLIESGKCPEIRAVWGEDADAAITEIAEMLK